MLDMIIGTYKRKRKELKNATPLTYILGRVIRGLFTILVSHFMYENVFNQTVSDSFIENSGSLDYMTFVVIGSAVHVLGVSTMMSVGRGLISELRMGTLEPLLLSPKNKIAYFLGLMVEQVQRSTVEFIIVLLFGVLFGAKLSFLLSIKSILALSLIIISFFSMSVLVAAMMIYTRDTYVTQNTLFIFMYFICGISFPISYLPLSLQAISSVFPMTHSINLVRYLASGTLLYSNWVTSISFIVILSTLYFMLGYGWYRRYEKKILENNLS